ncbi:MAG: Rrf2 family transcriptional regulator [Candidatus Bipolaricaulia bacterium]
MHLTKKASYGLIAAFELARAPGSKPLSASSIAARYDLPAPFIEKILHRLRQSGLVVSRQGRSGGYALAEAPREISVRRVLEALGEPLDLVGCLGPSECCDLTDICPTKPAWSMINHRFHALLDSMSLDDLHGRAGKPAEEAP